MNNLVLSAGGHLVDRVEQKLHSYLDTTQNAPLW